MGHISSHLQYLRHLEPVDGAHLVKLAVLVVEEHDGVDPLDLDGEAALVVDDGRRRVADLYAQHATVT